MHQQYKEVEKHIIETEKICLNYHPKQYTACTCI